MRYFIFITAEGYTYQPDSESSEPDVENCQVLGYGKGFDARDAFENFRANSPWLIKSSFRELISYELKDPKVPAGYFSLSD